MTGEVDDFVLIVRPVPMVEAWLLRHDGHSLDAPFAEAFSMGAHLRDNESFSGAGESSDLRAQIWLGPPLKRKASVVHTLAITAEPTTSNRVPTAITAEPSANQGDGSRTGAPPFCTLEGELELAPVGDSSTVFSLRGVFRLCEVPEDPASAVELDRMIRITVRAVLQRAAAYAEWTIPSGEASERSRLLAGSPRQRTSARQPEPSHGIEDRLEELDDETCRRLLAGASVGRVCTGTLLAPHATPVNFVFTGSSILFKSGGGTKLSAARLRAPVVFEVDDYDSLYHTGWSVVAHGRLREVTGPSYLEELERLAPEPWAGGLRSHLLRMTVDRLSGRRVVSRARQPLHLAETSPETPSEAVHSGALRPSA
jgi:hypothetical protein